MWSRTVETAVKLGYAVTRGSEGGHHQPMPEYFARFGGYKHHNSRDAER